MPRNAVETNNRLALRVSREAKGVLVRAASLTNMDVTSFVLQNILPVARALIEQAEQLKLSGRDSISRPGIVGAPAASQRASALGRH